MRNALFLAIASLMTSAPAFAEEAVNSAGTDAYAYLAAGLAIGIAALGGALGQARIGGNAMEGIARNPQAQKDMFVPMIIGLVLIESLVIYAFVISFLMIG